MAPIIRRPIVPPTPKQLPQSFLKAGFLPPEQARRGTNGLRGLMIATEGRSDTGKTEFCLSAPGPGVILACDRGFQAMVDNQTPPRTRRDDFGIKPLRMPRPTDFSNAADYVPFYQQFYREAMQAISLPEARTVCIDGDNFSWDLQRLAEWGKITGVWPQTKYADPKAARMSFYWTLADSGKIVITTNMLKMQWRDKIDPVTGLVATDKQGEAIREPTGEYIPQGFADSEYVFQIRIRHLYRGARVMKILGKEKHLPAAFGLKITKCKVNRELEGTELWGDDCNFAGLVQTVYPHIQLSEWGF